MAFRFEKGKHIYFLFKGGHTVQDSQLKPRYYLDRHKAEIHLYRGDEIVEYAPVVHGRWVPLGAESDYDLWFEWKCSECGENYAYDEEIIPYNFCPNCGADMRGGANG